MSEQKSGTLYILGNGFDRCHGLDTRPEKFLDILEKKEIYNENETAKYVFERYSVYWSNFEMNLANIDLELIAEEQLIAPDYYSDRESDRDCGIFNMEQYTESLGWAIQESLGEMVDEANAELEHKTPALKNFLCSSDAVVSFNYTSTLEHLYEIPVGVEVCHIHGMRDKNERMLLGFRDGISEEAYYNECFNQKTVEELLEKMQEVADDETLSKEEKEQGVYYYQMCYDEVTSDRDFYIDKQKEIVFQFYQTLRKEIQTGKLKEFLKNKNYIKKVVVMGHSMQAVDSDYMEVIENILCPNIWEISQHNNEPSKEMLKEYTFASKVRLYDLNEVYSR